jgi:hypothetical protein
LCFEDDLKRLGKNFLVMGEDLGLLDLMIDYLERIMVVPFFFYDFIGFKNFF